MRDLQGKVVAVTGGASGIGAAIAETAARCGAAVAVLDVDAERAASVADTINSSGGRSRAYTTDLTDAESVRQAFTAVGDEIGGLTGLVCSAAVQLFGQDDACADVDIDVFDTTVAVNLRGAFLATKFALPALCRTRGSIVYIGSPTGLYGVAPGFTAYSTAKAGMLGLCRVVAADYARAGVRSNLVVPGFTATPLVSTILDDENLVAQQMQRTLIQRPGRPADVASMVSYLLSEEAEYVTGAVLPVDGGMTAI